MCIMGGGGGGFVAVMCTNSDTNFFRIQKIRTENAGFL